MNAELEDARLYPPSIVRWEIEHHVVREVRNGMIYIRCLDMAAMEKKLAAEKEARRREAIGQRIAEAQAAAYLGEV